MKFTLRIGENSASLRSCRRELGRVALGGRVAAAGVDGELHRDLAVLGQRADAVSRVEARDAVDERDVARGDDALALLVEPDGVDLVGLDLDSVSFKLRMMSVTSSTTPGSDVNSCSAPSIAMCVIAAPCSDDSRILRSATPERRAEAALQRLAAELAVGVGSLFDLERACLIRSRQFLA